MARKSLELQRLDKMKALCARTGWPLEGHYKVTDGDNVRWFLVTISFYPKPVWWIEDCGDTVVGETIPGTRRKLDEDTMRRLETWL